MPSCEEENEMGVEQTQQPPLSSSSSPGSEGGWHRHGLKEFTAAMYMREV